MISLAGGGAIVLPQDGPRKWAFKLSPTEPISIGLVLDHLQKNGKGKSIATIGIATSYGEGFLKAFEAIGAGSAASRSSPARTTTRPTRASPPRC